VTVTNAAFRIEDTLPAVQLWEQDWFWPLLKQGGAGLVIILLIFGVLRPAVKGLIQAGEGESAAAQSTSGGTASGSDAAPSEGVATRVEDMLALGRGDELIMLEAPQSYEKRLEFAQRAIDQDPKRVAQLIKTWMGSHG
jgi:flagellar M-ring protein FliF